jgi:methylated-DNA-[protein]-cysteine S-methyltransferase
VAEFLYQLTPSPLGDLLVAGTEEGICAIEVEPGEMAVADLGERLGRNPNQDRELRPVVRALTDYLGGRRRQLDLPVDLSLATPFARRVLRRLMRIEFGQLTSYGALAQATGTSARAVGGAVGSNPVPIVVPCHRVVAADGSLGGYGLGLDRKRMLLRLEGHDNLRGGWAPRRRAVSSIA